MKTTDKIPIGKLNRAGKILKTSLKVGKNYAFHYGSKLLQGDVDNKKLDKKNAADIMESLLELKGSGLKVAQMLSMEKSLLPKAYSDQFSLAQFSVPPLSVPLVKKTFRKYLSKNPEDLFDEFNYEAAFAASIGQVHKARIVNQYFAVKIQYPGVAESITSDLAILKPMASKIMRLDSDEAEKYFIEVQDKLAEETDYALELKNGEYISDACKSLGGYKFPKFYKDLSSDRIITMDWIDGAHLPDYAEQETSKAKRNRIAQKIWDLFMYQLFELRLVHADPHPGNLMITPDNEVCMLDFGCTKEVPKDFLMALKKLTDPSILERIDDFRKLLMDLDLLLPGDSVEESDFYFEKFVQVLSIALKPYQQDSWDFEDPSLFEEITKTGEAIAKETLFSKFNKTRGSKHFIYINRTFFGLFQLMHLLRAEISVQYPRD